MTTIDTVSSDDASLFYNRFPHEAKIARMSFFTAFVALAIGGALGLLQTLHRTDILRFMSSESHYYSVLTLHGVLLVLTFTIFFLVGVFTWAVTDSLDRKLANPRFSWLWYGLMSFGTLLAAIAMLGGLTDATDIQAEVLFTFYAPLQAHPIFYIGLALFLVGTWLAGADWIRSWWAWKQENPGERIPLRTFMVLMTMIMWYIATLGVATAVLVFILPWSLGLVDNVNALLTRTLFWYFGHPVVYFWLMPAYLLWYTVLPKLAGGRLFSDPLARVVFVLFLLLSTPVGIHHQYLDPGIAEGFKFIAFTNTMFLLLPSLLTAFTVVASVEYGARKLGGEGYLKWLTSLPWRNPAFTGMMLAGLLFAAGGFSGMINAGLNINYLVHNTMWVPGHFHLTVGTAVALTFMAGSYWLVPQLTGRQLYSSGVGLAQTILWFIGMIFMTNAMTVQGLLGVPRRTAEPQYGGFDFASASVMNELNIQLALGGVLLTVSLALFIGNIGLTAFAGKRDGIPSGVLPPAISGAEDSPKVLDNLKLWTLIAIVLVIIAYSLPLAGIITRGGLFGPGMLSALEVLV